jgi:hypothetical protein
MGLDLSPNNITALSAIRASEGNDGRAANAANAMILGGSLALASESSGATGTDNLNPITVDTGVSSQNAVDLPNVYDDLEATNTDPVAVTGPEVVGPDPVATEGPDPVVTAVEPEIADASTVTEPVAQQSDPIDFNNLSGGQALFVSDLRKLDLEELRIYADTSNPSTFQGRLSRQLYQDSRTREIMQMTDETTLRTILSNGTEWEKEAARTVVSNMSNPVGLVRVKLDDGSFRMAQQRRDQNGQQQFVDSATGQPIDQRINAVIDPAEDEDTMDRVSGMLSRANQPVEEARESLVSFISAADSAYKMTQILARNQNILTVTGGDIPAVLSRIQSEIDGLSTLFGEEGKETNITANQFNTRVSALEQETFRLFRNGQISEAARDRAIYQAQEKRFTYALIRSQQGSGVISNQDYNVGLEQVRSSVVAGTFEESLRQLILADETALTIRMGQVTENEQIRQAQSILDNRGMDFPLVQDMFRTVGENAERYGAGPAYQWLQGEINLAQGQSATLPPIGETQTVRLMDRVDGSEQPQTANVVVSENVVTALKDFVAKHPNKELAQKSAVITILENTPGLTEDQLRQMHPEFFTDISE